jgi:hypothetical protein
MTGRPLADGIDWDADHKPWRRELMPAEDLADAIVGICAGHPAWPWRCHVEDGQVIDPVTLRMIACDATISAIVHDAAGNVIGAGRRSRLSGIRLLVS